MGGEAQPSVPERRREWIVDDHRKRLSPTERTARKYRVIWQELYRDGVVSSDSITEQCPAVG